MFRKLRSYKIHCDMTIGWHIERYWAWTVIRYMYCPIVGHNYYIGPPYTWKTWCKTCERLPNAKPNRDTRRK
jgi:hypothetical protein